MEFVNDEYVATGIWRGLTVDLLSLNECVIQVTLAECVINLMPPLCPVGKILHSSKAVQVPVVCCVPPEKTDCAWMAVAGSCVQNILAKSINNHLWLWMR